MSDIFPDRNIVDEINSNRGSSAEQKIQFRIMQALESIAESLHEYMHPPVSQPSKSIDSTSAVEVSNEITSLLQTAHEVGEGRRRRRQESA